MKRVLMRAVACEWLLFALLAMVASAQRQQTDLTKLQIEDLMILAQWVVGESHAD